MTYDTWKLASPFDNERMTDVLDVRVSFALLSADDGVTYDVEVRGYLTRQEVEDADQENMTEKFIDEILKEWYVEDGDKLTFKDVEIV